MILQELRVPIVLAPMGGGPATVELAVSVSEAGGLGFLASGYRGAAGLREEIHALRAQTSRPFGVNLFVPSTETIDEPAVARYLERLRSETSRYNTGVGEARYDDDDWDAKLALLRLERPPVVSFTFGCPPEHEVAALRELGVSVWVTVTNPTEALGAERSGADALVVQGVEAGGHRGGFSDTDEEETGLLALLRLVASETDLPLIAAGGVADGAALAAVLCAGAEAAQMGSAFMLASEAGTHPAHRAALVAQTPTALTRAFSGRRARGIVNRFLVEHSQAAPSAYPQVHHATSPLRAAARERGDAEGFNLWAGQAHALAQERPAREIVAIVAAQARARLASVTGRIAETDATP